MKKYWFRHILALAFAIVSGITLMRSSHEVQRTEREIAALEREERAEREEIRVLNAEWAYLNRPERLEALAAQYLELVPPGADQMISSVKDIPDEDIVPPIPPSLPASVARVREISYTVPSAAQGGNQ